MQTVQRRANTEAGDIINATRSSVLPVIDTTERERLALILAKTYGGWNEDTTEPEMPEGPARDHAEARWRRINEDIMVASRQAVDLLYAALLEALPKPGG